MLSGRFVQSTVAWLCCFGPSHSVIMGSTPWVKHLWQPGRRERGGRREKEGRRGKENGVPESEISFQGMPPVSRAPSCGFHLLKVPPHPIRPRGGELAFHIWLWSISKLQTAVRPWRLLPLQVDCPFLLYRNSVRSSYPTLYLGLLTITPDCLLFT